MVVVFCFRRCDCPNASTLRLSSVHGAFKCFFKMSPRRGSVPLLASLFAGTAITLLPLMGGSAAKQTSDDDLAVRMLLYFVVLLLLAYIGFASTNPKSGSPHQPRLQSSETAAASHHDRQRE